MYIYIYDIGRLRDEINPSWTLLKVGKSFKNWLDIFIHSSILYIPQYITLRLIYTYKTLYI